MCVCVCVCVCVCACECVHAYLLSEISEVQLDPKANFVKYFLKNSSSASWSGNSSNPSLLTSTSILD